MAAKRGKSQAKRNGGGNGGMSGGAWLVIGLALGVGVFLIAPKFLGRDGTGGVTEYVADGEGAGAHGAGQCETRG